MKKYSILVALLTIFALASCSKDDDSSNNNNSERYYDGTISGFVNKSFSGVAVNHVENTAGVPGLWTFQFGSVSNEDFDNPISLNMIFEILFTDVKTGVYPLVGEVNGNYYLQDDKTRLDQGLNGFFMDGVNHRYRDYRTPKGQVEITKVSSSSMEGVVQIEGDWEIFENQQWVNKGDGKLQFEFALPRR
ncbi:MAG: hypothetical protein LAT76_04290 [Schleiferiaceae bacterium]|nr:hypothetical protein [Schleiferiaceae bacterium]